MIVFGILLYLLNIATSVELIWCIWFLATQVPSTQETTTDKMVIQLQLNLQPEKEIGTKDPLEKGRHLYKYQSYCV